MELGKKNKLKMNGRMVQRLIIGILVNRNQMGKGQHLNSLKFRVLNILYVEAHCHLPSNVKLTPRHTV